MDQYELGVALAVPRIAGLRRQAGLLDHYRRVQQEKATLRQAHRRALEARRCAGVALWSSGAALLLAAVAPLSG